MTTTILGAGISGLSTSYHIGHDSCIIYEKLATFGGHAGSQSHCGFTIDQGPHVSFTKHDYAKDLFAASTAGEFYEYIARTRNTYQGIWIEHPAQAHLWQVPEPMRTLCTADMIAAPDGNASDSPVTYAQWLEQAYGKTFSENFSSAYTRKYWTVEPKHLSVDWLGPRMPKLNVDEIKAGLVPGSLQNLHYITSIRYPKTGGFQSFFTHLAHHANIQYGMEAISIDLANKKIWFANGSCHAYERLVSTLPLPEFISRCQQTPEDIRHAAAELDCTQLFIVDVFCQQDQQVPGHWFYVYDEDKWTTRIHCIEQLSPHNTPDGWVGVQAEVYFSKYKPYPGTPSRITAEVTEELVSMGLIDPTAFLMGHYKTQWRWSSYANVMFTHPRRAALEKIWTWLERYGLRRRIGDTDADTDWTSESVSEGILSMAGRFAEWKYYWTDDCVLRGRQIANRCS